MNRPTVTLALIAKNEETNVPKLFESIRGCFDEIVFVDTGSTDKTVEVARFEAERIKTPIKLEHFTWINDFSAARNFAFDHATSDYVMWMDLDDVLEGGYEFIKWRDTAMEFGDYWLANYDYAFDDRGNAQITFMRERVVKNHKGLKWTSFIHEGIAAREGLRVNGISTWRIQHKRTAEDIQKDRNRNIEIIEKRLQDLDSRLKFYYGKELFEVQQYEKSLKVLLDAATLTDLGLDDRVLALQYACYAGMAIAAKYLPEHREEHYARARSLAFQGLQLTPKRAEFFNIIAESFLYSQRFTEALPYLNAQEKCEHHLPGGKVSGAIFSFSPLYTDVPKMQKAKAYFNLGLLDEAEKEAKSALDLYQSEDAAVFLKELETLKPLMNPTAGPKIQTPEIVFTCPPVQAYPFDEELAKTKGLGGSETALVQVAAWLKKLTGRPVKVFNMRSSDLVADSGVEYVSNQKLNEYVLKYKPFVHIAWRHNTKLTDAPTYLWCHDLVTPTCEHQHNFDKMLCLTPFHREYVHAMQGIPYEKIITTRNGLDPQKFRFQKKEKNPNKVVWMSSPDRGLDRCMKVMDLARKLLPDLELHVYYGLENLYKFGLSDMADRLKKMMRERPWVTYHGFTEQEKMYHEVSDAAIWLHPCDFIETYCITAIEMLALGVYPITRRLGGLKDTLKSAEAAGMAKILDHDCVTEDEFRGYATALVEAVTMRSWERVHLNPESVSWRGVAEDWINFMELESPKPLAPTSNLKETSL